MNIADVTELSLIFLATAVTVVVAKMLPHDLALGEIALAASAMLLGQGLARDLWIKYGRKSASASVCAVPGTDTSEDSNPQPATCMCVESSLGLFGIVAGAFALLSGVSRSVSLPAYFWPILILCVGLLGFAMKSLVIDWKARRIRREPNHSSVRFGK